MYFRVQILLWAGVALAGLSITDDAVAVQKKNKKATTTAPGQHASVIAELHQAKALLDIALYDYHGYRAKADHHVRHALHVLHHGHNKKFTGQARNPGKLTQHRPHDHQAHVIAQLQQASDIKLRRAEQIVRNAAAQLSTASANRQHVHAHQQLVLAVREIEQALSVVHNYHVHHQQALAALK